jgi:hypothetical protein
VEVINQEPETVPEYGELTNSGPSTNPLLKSNCNPKGCSTAVTGVVPALSWKRVEKFDGSYHQPCSPLANRDAGENPKEPYIALNEFAKVNEGMLKH